MNEIDKYIQKFPEATQEILRTIRFRIKTLVPEAEEQISYGIPGYKTNGKPLVYFAAFKNHIGLYATPTGHEHFKKALSGYKQGKGSVQFPFSKPIPYDLIDEIVKFRAKENEGGIKRN